jgi:voltage-gated potassium channel Kch
VATPDETGAQRDEGVDDASSARSGEPELRADVLAEERSGRTWRNRDFQDEYGIALGLFVLVMLLPVLLPHERWANTLTASVAALGALVALHSSRVKPWLLRSTTAAAVMIVLLVVFRDPSEAERASFYVAVAFVLFVTPVAILVRIAHHKVITPRTLYGALCVYLLLGLGFSFLYQALDHVDQGSFPAITANDRVAFAYYSFITLTTVGYGDIAPATDAARQSAVFEAVLGQVFLVVVVARVVSMLGHERPTTSRPVLGRIHRADDE